MKQKVYLIGSLRNPVIPDVARVLRYVGYDVFDDWFAAGPEADDKWKDYEKARGRSYIEALEGEAANHVYSFDRRHLEAADIAVLICPAGKSGHLELGWFLGGGKPGFILLENDKDRWDVMYRFATGVATTVDGLIEKMKAETFRREKQPQRKDCCPNMDINPATGHCHSCGLDHLGRQWVPYSGR